MIFLALVGHMDSENMDIGLFSASLRKMATSQPELAKLIKVNCFISVGYTHNCGALTFNQEQNSAVIEWLNRYKTDTAPSALSKTCKILVLLLKESDFTI